jgi:5-dehydro-2-deoxygluconokinase
VLGNEEELTLLTGEREPAAQVKAVLASGVGLLVSKLGANGVRADTGHESFTVPPVPVKVVSAIGAGDAFASGLLYALHRGLPTAECLRWGNAAAAIVVGRVSCSDAMPYAQEVEQLLGA